MYDFLDSAVLLLRRLVIYAAVTLVLVYGAYLAMSGDYRPLVVTERNITLPGTASDIFRLILDIEFHKKWCRHVEDYEIDDVTPIGVGKRYFHTTVLPLLGTLQREMQIVELDPPYYMSYIQDTWLLPKVDMTLAPQAKGTVRFTWAMTTRWTNHLFKYTILPIARWFNEMAVNEALLKLRHLAQERIENIPPKDETNTVRQGSQSHYKTQI